MCHSVIEFVATHAVTQPNKVAVITKERETTYGDLYQMVTGYAVYLRKCGVGKGSIVVVRSSQTLQYVIIYLAIHLSGGIVTSLEKNIPDEGLARIAEKLHADVILSDNTSIPVNSAKCAIVTIGDVIEISSDQNITERFIFPQSEDSADILFTTGTTGQSKGAELSHRALVATAENLIDGCGYKKDTVLIAPGPLNHANAIRKLFTTLINGSTIYILNGMLNMKAFFDALDYPHGAIACCLPPSAIRTIFQNTGEKLGEYSHRIDFIESATSPMPEVDKEHLRRLLPKTRLFNLYGASETGSVCLYDYNKFVGKENCVGIELPNSKVIIVNDEHKTICSSPTNTGLIACIGDMNMKRYVNEPDLTSEVIQNGVLYTNYIGR